MSVWDPDTWQWWLEHGFDGIGAGIIGGLVTGGAVWLTIRHERKLREEDRLEAKHAELRLAVRQLQGDVMALMVATALAHSKGSAGESFLSGVGRAVASLLGLLGLANEVAPELAADLEVFRVIPKVQGDDDKMDFSATRNWLTLLNIQLTKWTGNPGAYKRSPDKLRSRLDQGV